MKSGYMRARGWIWRLGVTLLVVGLPAAGVTQAELASAQRVRVAQANTVTGGSTQNDASRKASAESAAADAQKSFEAAKAKAVAAQKAAAEAAARAVQAREAATKATEAPIKPVAPKPQVKPRPSTPILKSKAKPASKPSTATRPPASNRSVAKPPVAARPARSCLTSEGPCRVFVSSTTYTGDLGGAAGADRKCLAAAEAAGLSGIWRAWISCAACGPEGKPVHAKDRIANAQYQLVDGTEVAESVDAMLGCEDDCLRAAISLTESGKPAGEAGRGRPWTGTFGNGLGKGRPNCRDWTSSAEADDGEVGMSTKRDEDWTSRSALTPCSRPAALICFEQ